MNNFVITKSSIKRKTIKKEIIFSGTGVHSGKESRVILQPSKDKTGINFIKNKQSISLNITSLEKSPLCTKLKHNNLEISTVEHLLSALSGLGINDINIVVEGDEIPILDGSTKIFVDKLYPEIIDNFSALEFIKLNKSIWIRDKDKFIIAIPNDELEINYFLEYTKFPYFLSHRFIYSSENYTKEISHARTFGFLSDAEYLNKNGLALGSSYENTLVINDDSYSSKLRYYNEPVRHKILDLIGDLAFLNMPVKAKILCYKTGHTEHLKLVEKICVIN